MLHKKVPVHSALEALESRIAPAVVFLAGTDALRNGVSVSVPDSATHYGVDAAFLLKTGDSLVVDVNHDGIFQASDDLLVAKVSKGRALMFFDDRDGIPGFSIAEIGGAMVSNGFVGEINADLHGSVVAGLTARGDVGWDTTPSTIAGLTVTGTVHGKILADGAIKNVTIKSAGNDNLLSVQAILSGSAAAGLFNFGATSEEYISSATAKSPSDIFNISLARGVETMISGFGINGGDISKVTIGHQVTSLTLRAGDSSLMSGGHGGSIRDIEIHGSNHAINFTIQAGWGSMRKTHAGEGGSIDTVSILAGGEHLGTVEIASGNGGDYSYSDGDNITYANGGKGGDLRGFTLVADSVGTTTILSGHGGQAGFFQQAAVTETREKVIRHRDIFGDIIEETVNVEVVIRPEILRNGHGGDGGTIEDIQIHAQTALEMRAGQGGQSQLRGGGDAGSILDVETRGLLSAYIYGGIAGSGFIGGNGGNIADFSASDIGANADVLLVAGDSGEGSKKVGRAGDISRISVSSHEALAQLQISAGNGYPMVDTNTDSIVRGSDGGSISEINVDVKSASGIQIDAGVGGSGGFRAIEVGNPEVGRVVQQGGAGGNGGDVADVRIHAQQIVENLVIASGSGGDGRAGKAAGSGGSISNIELGNYSNGEILSGSGGFSTAGRSGDGGDISNLTFTGGFAGTYFGITAGEGGEGGEEGATGGHGGSIAHVTGREITSGTLSIVAGKGGNGTEFTVEPQFVDVERSRLVPDGFGGWTVEFVTKSIKVANRIARAGAGGDGGSVSNITWDVVSGGDTGLIIYSGAGGDGTSASAEFERLVKIPDPLGGYYEDYQTYSKLFVRKDAGAGGDIRDVKMSAPENTVISLTAEAGKGGNGINYAAPARGGAITGIGIDSLGLISWLSLNAGDGGDASDATPRAVGRPGGSIKNVYVNADDIRGNSMIVGGDGGYGPKRAGAGGDLVNISLPAYTVFDFELVPGNGDPAGELEP